MTLTPAQQDVWDLKQQGLNVAQIARKLDRDESTVREHLRKAQAKQDTDPAVQTAMDTIGTGMVPSAIWVKTDTHSVMLRPAAAAERTWLETLADTFANLPAAMPVPKPRTTDADLMAVYPIFDLHLGMRAHKIISGKEVTLESARDEALAAMAEIIEETPNARRAVIINGGDFTHQTDDRNMTRRSNHVLDVSARNSVTVDTAIELLSTLIEMALRKHEVVEYYSVPGNHDPQNWETIQFTLRERYRDNPRVTISVRWDEFSVVEHGKVSLFIHHGDKRTPKDLCMFISASFAQEWARTGLRYLFTGHLHHLKLDEFPGITWRQIAASGARDHHASSHAYLSNRVLGSMVFNAAGTRRREFEAIL